MDIKIIYIATGMIMGDIEYVFNGNYKVTDPCFIQMTQQGIQLFPMLAGTEEDYVVIETKNIVFKNVDSSDYTFTPIKMLVDEYTLMFNKVSIAVPPEKKIIL